MNDIMLKLDKMGAECGDALGRFMNDEEMYVKYLRGFPEEPTYGRLVDAVDNKDYQAAEKAVHALKGIVNNLGLLPLADATMDMLEELRENHLEEALDAYEDVQEEYKRFCQAIKEWRE